MPDDVADIILRVDAQIPLKLIGYVRKKAYALAVENAWDRKGTKIEETITK